MWSSFLGRLILSLLLYFPLCLPENNFLVFDVSMCTSCPQEIFQNVFSMRSLISHSQQPRFIPFSSISLHSSKAQIFIKSDFWQKVKEVYAVILKYLFSFSFVTTICSSVTLTRYKPYTLYLFYHIVTKKYINYFLYFYMFIYYIYNVCIRYTYIKIIFKFYFDW